MTDAIEFGTATAEPGAVSRGELEVTQLPTGGSETVPVVVANGAEDGPMLWVTGGVHGDEATGVAVAQDVIHDSLPAVTAGAVVSVPVVSPAGVRRNDRRTYYRTDDPNRKFPDLEEPLRQPGVQELIAERLYDEIVDSADALLDMHTAGAGAAPFVIKDRALYGETRSEEEARALADSQDRVADTFGLPPVYEYVAEEYVAFNFNRSLSGAVFNQGDIPAVTVELGAHSVVDDNMLAQGVAGTYRVMSEFGMLDSPEDASSGSLPDPIRSPVDYPTRRHRGPRTDTAGLVRHHVKAGEVVSEGDPLADVVGPAGEKRETVTANHDGWIVQRYDGIQRYENDPVVTMAIREDDLKRVGERD
jgi:predicted deacylase